MSKKMLKKIVRFMFNTLFYVVNISFLCAITVGLYQWLIVGMAVCSVNLPFVCWGWSDYLYLVIFIIIYNIIFCPLYIWAFSDPAYKPYKWNIIGRLNKWASK